MKKGISFISLFWAALAAIVFLDSCHSSKKAAASKKQKSTYAQQTKPSKRSKKHAKSNPPPESAEAPAKDNSLASKYASQLGVSKRDITNYTLYKFIDSWYGTPYKYAGRTKAGVDCSDLASLLFQSVYGITIGGTCTDEYNKCKPVKASELKEGDLVFFKINSKSLSHVGIYLQNHKFVHASVHAGVIISDLGEDYYRKYYWGAGRLLK